MADASLAVLASYAKRFNALNRNGGLVEHVKWMLSNCGAIEICRVAAGDLDVAVEFAKGFRIWDVAAAAHILEKAGGKFRAPAGHKIFLTSQPDERFQFVKKRVDVASHHAFSYTGPPSFSSWP